MIVHKLDEKFPDFAVECAIGHADTESMVAHGEAYQQDGLKESILGLGVAMVGAVMAYQGRARESSRLSKVGEYMLVGGVTSSVSGFALSRRGGDYKAAATRIDWGLQKDAIIVEPGTKRKFNTFSILNG